MKKTAVIIGKILLSCILLFVIAIGGQVVSAAIYNHTHLGFSLFASSALGLDIFLVILAIASLIVLIMLWFKKKKNSNDDEVLPLSNTQEQSHENSELSQTASGNTTADELKKYKELLDSDVITQEEFDAKKKQLLGL